MTKGASEPRLSGGELSHTAPVGTARTYAGTTQRLGLGGHSRSGWTELQTGASAVTAAGRGSFGGPSPARDGEVKPRNRRAGSGRTARAGDGLHHLGKGARDAVPKNGRPFGPHWLMGAPGHGSGDGDAPGGGLLQPWPRAPPLRRRRARSPASPRVRHWQARRYMSPHPHRPARASAERDAAGAASVGLGGAWSAGPGSQLRRPACSGRHPLTVFGRGTDNALWWRHQTATGGRAGSRWAASLPLSLPRSAWGPARRSARFLCSCAGPTARSGPTLGTSGWSRWALLGGKPLPGTGPATGGSDPAAHGSRTDHHVSVFSEPDSTQYGFADFGGAPPPTRPGPITIPVFVVLASGTDNALWARGGHCRSRRTDPRTRSAASPPPA